MDCDVIVVGSGFGGSVIAARAAEAGMRVIVLERGRRLTESALNEFRNGQASLFCGRYGCGPLDLHLLGGLFALTGNAVGGGSQIYTASTVPAPAEIFERGWPGGLNHLTLQPCFERVRATINPSPIPRDVPRTRMLADIGQRIGVPCTRLPLAIEWPNDAARLEDASPNGAWREDVVTWLRGGHAARKRSLDQTYVRIAEASGADIRPLHEATHLEQIDGGFRVHFDQQRDTYVEPASLTAPSVVLAAGTLNSVRLLLEARDVDRTLPNLSAALGRGFYTNGDYGAVLLAAPADLLADSAPPTTAWLDFWRTDRLFIMEMGAVPVNPTRSTRRSGKRGASTRRGARRGAWMLAVMGFDDNPGTLILDRRGRLVHRFDYDRSAAFLRRRTARLRELAEAAEGTLLGVPRFIERRRAITVHPLGGAAMADRPDDGVTDSSGRVFGYEGLYVADGSLLPTPTGGPPSMTIAALAERVAEHLIATSR